MQPRATYDRAFSGGDPRQRGYDQFLPCAIAPGRNAKEEMELKIGDKFLIERTVTDELIRKFAEVSGDYNPIHLDEDVAKNTRFGRRIAHGMLSGAFISAVLGYEFSERRIVYLSQTLKFTLPVFIGDTVTASA